MGKRGFLLIGALMGLFIMGLVTVTCIPIINSTLMNIDLVKDKTNMMLVAESIIEQIKSFDYGTASKDESLYGMNLTNIIEMLKNEDSVKITLPLDKDYENFEYRCIIYKENKDGSIWRIWVTVISPKGAKNIEDVEIQAFMPIPREKDI